MWARETGAIALGLRLVGRMRLYWFSRFHEGQEWLECFIDRAGTPVAPEDHAALAEAWTGVMVIADRQGRFERAREAGERALALRRERGDSALIADAMMNLANVLGDLRDYARARAVYEDCLALQRAAENRRGMVLTLLNLGTLAYNTWRPREALAFYEESLAVSRAVGENEWARALTWTGVGEVLIVLDEPVRALEAIGGSYRLFSQARDTFGIAACAFALGRAEWRTGDLASARGHLDEAERLFGDLGNPAMVARVRYVRASLALDEGDDQDTVAAARRDLARATADLADRPDASDVLWWIVERVGTLARHQGRLETAARLAAAGIAGRDALPGPIDPAERALRARDQSALHAALAPALLNAAMAEGRSLTLDAAVTLARRALEASR